MNDVVLNRPTEEAETVFLVNTTSDFELRLVRKWLKEQPWVRNREFKLVAIGDAAEGNAEGLSDVLEGLNGEPGKLWLQPLRAVWNLEETPPGEGTLLKDLFAGIRYNPGPLRQRMIARTNPERVKIVEGQGAYLRDVKERFDLTWKSQGVSDARLAEFVRRQALLALDRAERRLRGARYKMARLLPRDVTSNPEFQASLSKIAVAQGKSLSKVEEESYEYLREMAAMQTPFGLDLLMGLQRRACQGHHEKGVDFIPEELERFRKWTEEGPVAVLITHKSMLDTMALTTVLFDSNIPVPLGFGGINLATPGISSVARRGGAIFLRREFKSNEVYKITFRRYVDYLLEKRFAFYWALEGTRSRTGKLLPPRYGLTTYVVESLLRTGQHNLKFVPVTVAYDQITEVEDYVIEQKGQEKTPEGAGWILKFIRGRAGTHGRIYLRFGDPVTALDVMDESELSVTMPQEKKRRLVEQISLKTAFQMNEATPITLTSLLTLTLLSGGPRGRTLNGLARTVGHWMRLVRARNIPIAGNDNLDTPHQIERTLSQLEENGVVKRHDTAHGSIFQIQADQHHRAAYYRNTVIHFFVTDAFIELALLAAAATEDSEAVFWREVLALRDLFKFEFYFQERDAFLREVREKMAGRDEQWEVALQKGGAEVRTLIDKSVPLVAQGVLRSFVDAYQILANHLVGMGTGEVTNKKKLYVELLHDGKEALLLQRIFSEESVSKSLYETAGKLAEFRGLYAGEEDTLHQARVAFAEELRSIGRRLDIVLGLTVGRQTD